MKKSNWAIFVILAVVSVFLLWLWYYLGFNQIDDPLDLVLSIIWWCVIAGLIYLIVRSEKKRQRAIRTIYVSEDALFNSERGLVLCPDPSQRVALMESILENLEYTFDMVSMPEADEFTCCAVVTTDEFEPAKKDDQGNDTQEPTWQGEFFKVVPAVATDPSSKPYSEGTKYGTKEALAALVA